MSKKYIVIIIIVLFCLLLMGYGWLAGKNNETFEDKKSDTTTYDDFKKEYSEYNWNDEEIREDNYYLFEDEFFSRKYSKFLECEIKRVNKDAFLILNNTSDEYLGSVKTTIIFYDENNQIIDVRTEYTNDIEYGGKRVKILTRFPLEYARVDFFNEIDKAREISNLRISNIKCELDSDGNIIITNNNTEECEGIYGMVFFYDEQENITDWSSFYLTDGIKPDESKTEKLYNFPSSYTSYEVIISSIR